MPVACCLTPNAYLKGYFVDTTICRANFKTEHQPIAETMLELVQPEHFTDVVRLPRGKQSNERESCIARFFALN